LIVVVGVVVGVMAAGERNGLLSVFLEGMKVLASASGQFSRSASPVLMDILQVFKCGTIILR
jgi:hypothetical protein